MENKKRLEELKKELELNCSNVFCVVNKDNVKWLINRIEELELEVNELIDEDSKWNEYFQESEKNRLKTKELLYSKISENQRLKQALEFYADEENYKESRISEAQYDADGVCISNDEYIPPIIYFDKGEIARKVLEG